MGEETACPGEITIKQADLPDKDLPDKDRTVLLFQICKAFPKLYH